ncbi:hypothetical protein [Mycolicibacterium sp. F2034L]|uniref:hypothetical protein n=1 Tax=Mycolicibacterium sp. F2034L TaxID=2926422 RepID=UPI001FF293BC|nr:hypothetical protein [Mycolicibacterium sp. F2034L]MCK0173884.1 hypothetical protein [Mycolicibacterium sp. F2034L]
MATQGSGPYDENDFDEFLVECGVEVRTVSGDEAPIAIFGREMWEEDDIDELWARAGGNIRVYSQEMVVASIAIGGDVIDLSNGEINDFIDGHPALEPYYYEAEPDEVIFPGLPPSPVPMPQRKLLVNLDTGAWPTSGVLGEMGYRVGRSGLVDGARKRILAEVLSVELVATSPAAEAYVDEWGPPNSPKRLQKMVNSIAAFARNARRRDADFSEAIADWENDLEWLRVTFSHS